ncbi:MAG: DUF6502 family protein [Pseudomonadota bacterium]
MAEPPPPGRTQENDALAHALAVMRPLALWLVRSGVGHGALATALKPVFLDAACAETRRAGTRPTDSALSLLSGLHRKDVKALGGAHAQEAPAPRPARATPAQQVVARWLAGGLPPELPFAGEGDCFEALARTVSRDVHPRSVLQELLRLGIATEETGRVRLRREAFVPDPAHREAGQLLAESVADHLNAGVHNLGADGPVRYLDQSVFADELSEASVRELEALGNRLWAGVLKDMVAAATVLCERDAAAAAAAAGRAETGHRLRLGMFCYSTRMAPLAPLAPVAPAAPAAPAAPPAGSDS